MPLRMRFPLMLIGILALLVGLWAGWIRMGWAFPRPNPAWPGAHGALMISGFLGTLITLERAIVGPRWVWGAPILAALGSLTLLLMPPTNGSAVLFLGSALVLAALFVHAARRRMDPAILVLGFGAMAWGIGQLIWLGSDSLAKATPWWTAFLVLTIVGERLELARVIPRGRGMIGSFWAGVGLVLFGLILSLFLPAWGQRVLGLGWLALAAWLAHYDIARRTVRQHGLVRYLALCMLAGYLWLGIGGGLEWLPGEATAGPLYDARLHAVLIGFVFSMIFGHALIIFPAVLRVNPVFSSTLYLPLVLLHLSLVVRLIGDLGGIFEVRRWGGLLNGVAILLFLTLILRGIRAGRKASPGPLAASSEDLRLGGWTDR
ncbi:hypothetical protein [Thermoflexus sp.]|uniref:hypothetical protein n=1 Tax=Thermoflexus sp. TaxID=1969742 RepID=UPI00260D18D5|nr:hypothetical protein [Thermoflexus sp.]MCX7689590.1 hypothetical protein [Thermoflexus sp.]